jgi:DNA-binding transcriptional regulator YiaG
MDSSADVAGGDAINSLPERQRRLVTELRRMRERSGLTLAQLAARTHYGKSSWGRWLAGDRPIPP